MDDRKKQEDQNSQDQGSKGGQAGSQDTEVSENNTTQGYDNPMVETEQDGALA